MFECTKCGQCCKKLNNSDLYRELDRGDGTCKYLHNNLCSIYENRPLICRVDESYQVFFKERYAIEEYYALNYEACKKLQSK